MVTNLCLLSCVLAAAQPADCSEWLVLPRLSKAQELVYRGSCVEEAGGSGVQFTRRYRLECRVLVLDANPNGADLAFLTIVKMTDKGAGNGEPRSFSCRLERARLDVQGKLSAPAGVSLAAPLERPPSLECGAFVEAPGSRLAAEQTWKVSEAGRPLRTWRAAGEAVANGVKCIKLVGVQQSADWEQPRADHVAWKRTDTVWMNPRLGAAERVERVIERRALGDKDPSQRIEVKYDLESSLQYPAQLFEDRRREIAQIQGYTEAAGPMLAAPAKHIPRLEALQAKIANYLEHQPPSPYREVLGYLQDQVVAARKGEAPPMPSAQDATEAPAIAQVGSVAPDFVAPVFGTKESAGPRRWLGKPVLMVFYNPNSPTADELLRFAQMTGANYRDAATVVALAMSEDAEKVRKQQAELRLTYPLLSGLGLRKTYDVEATPKLMVLDAEGIVRGAYVGWGPETADNVLADLKRSQSRTNATFRDPPVKK